MRISDWSSDVCSSDLLAQVGAVQVTVAEVGIGKVVMQGKGAAELGAGEIGTLGRGTRQVDGALADVAAEPAVGVVVRGQRLGAVRFGQISVVQPDGAKDGAAQIQAARWEGLR